MAKYPGYKPFHGDAEGFGMAYSGSAKQQHLNRNKSNCFKTDPNIIRKNDRLKRYYDKYYKKRSVSSR